MCEMARFWSLSRLLTSRCSEIAPPHSNMSSPFFSAGCGRCLDKFLGIGTAAADGEDSEGGRHVDASNDRIYDEGVAAAYAHAFFYADGTDYQA